MSTSDWYKLNNCDHAHCPFECEHPQPFIFDGKLVCGRCYFIDHEISFMIPCNPEICGE